MCMTSLIHGKIASMLIGEISMSVWISMASILGLFIISTQQTVVMLWHTKAGAHA